MLFQQIALELTEALLEKATDEVRNQVQQHLQAQLEKKVRLENRTCQEWQDLIFTIAFTGNFPPEKKEDILARQLAGLGEEIKELKNRISALSELVQDQVNYLVSAILDSEEQSRLLEIVLEDDFLKKEIPALYDQLSNKSRPKSTPQEIANSFAQRILEDEWMHRKSIQDIHSYLMPSGSIADSSKLFAIWKKQAILKSEEAAKDSQVATAPGEKSARLKIYSEMEHKFVTILLVQLRYMQLLLDAYRVNYATPLVKERMAPQEFLNGFYNDTYEPQVREFVDTIEQWLINVFPYPLSPASQVDVPPDIQQILAQLDYFAEKALKPVKEYVTVFNWDDPANGEPEQLKKHLRQAYAVGEVADPIPQDEATLVLPQSNSPTGGQIILSRIPNPPMPPAYDATVSSSLNPALQPAYDGTVSLKISGKECSTYHYQNQGVMAMAQPSALWGRIFIAGDRWREYRDQSKVLVRIVDGHSGGKQFDAVGLLEFRAVKFLPPEQNKPVRGIGLLVGAQWKQFNQLLLATFSPCATVIDTLPAGQVTLEMRSFADNRLLQRMKAQFTTAEDSPQQIVHRSFTTFMATGVEMVSWKSRPAA